MFRHHIAGTCPFEHPRHSRRSLRDYRQQAGITGIFSSLIFNEASLRKTRITPLWVEEMRRSPVINRSHSHRWVRV